MANRKWHADEHAAASKSARFGTWVSTKHACSSSSHRHELLRKSVQSSPSQATCLSQLGVESARIAAVVYHVPGERHLVDEHRAAVRQQENLKRAPILDTAKPKLASISTKHPTAWMWTTRCGIAATFLSGRFGESERRKWVQRMIWNTDVEPPPRHPPVQHDLVCEVLQPWQQ